MLVVSVYAISAQFNSTQLHSPHTTALIWQTSAKCVQIRVTFVRRISISATLAASCSHSLKFLISQTKQAAVSLVIRTLSCSWADFIFEAGTTMAPLSLRFHYHCHHQQAATAITITTNSRRPQYLKSHN